MRRLVRVVTVILLALAVALVVLWAALRHPPTATAPGADAEALARDMVRAVDGDAWNRTGAVRWLVQGRAHLWDRQRGLARVEWHGNRVLLDVNRRDGRVWRKGVELADGVDKHKLIEHAYALWVNDSFWLNPVVKAFDDGTSRAHGTVDGKRALLVSYASGGLTPGDKYLWILDDHARPVAWRLWVKILKIGGLELTWEGWTRLATGAWVATSHKIFGLDVVHLSDLAAAATLHDLEADDPFAPILK
ncbi:MAG: hypothetical protein LC659_08300 [Myxococcales bacterium]|nr:hypothetical protein [Myxococcales bacterium]